LSLLPVNKNDITIHPKSILNLVKVLEGNRKIIQTKASGNASIGNGTAPFRGL